MRRKVVGEEVSLESLISIKDKSVKIPQVGKLTHLQFRRFAGCPVCNLHLQTFFRRHVELGGRGVLEVIVFHATKEKMLENVIDVPFDLILRLSCFMRPKKRCWKMSLMFLLI